MSILSRQTRQERTNYPVKVVQFGDGNFMRAFADWQIHIMNNKLGWNAGVAVLQNRAGGVSAEQLQEQNGLFTVCVEGFRDGQAVREYTLVESVVQGINPYTNYEAYAELAVLPDLRFVLSNTTEAGIMYAEEDRLEDQPQGSFPGKLTALLYRRYQHFNGDPGKGLIIIPCELIERNGGTLRGIVLRHAEKWGLEEPFIQWLGEHNLFCSSLVDRIVSGYPQDRAAEMEAKLGYQDPFLTVAEPYHLWVIEGPDWLRAEFPAHQAGLNVIITDDLSPYRTRKVRILNGAHTALTPVAYLAGLNTVEEAVNHELCGAFVEALIQKEIIPVLHIDEQELRDYADAVLERFRNPYLRHQLLSIALNSWSKFDARLKPTLLSFEQQQKRLPDHMVFSLAALIVMYKGVRGSEQIQLSDEPAVLELFRQEWGQYDGTRAAAGQLVSRILQNTRVCGGELGTVAGLAEQAADYVHEIEASGMSRTLAQFFGISDLLISAQEGEE
ncbi:tagaturonate reductase [Paenibacillus medicaginis]|uniref:Tagaturonate reductase n=1 Tax=Paenibacillus medicaginis TaxID=1470560 RepID=A0ABV5C3M0_9BACL